MNIKRNMKGFSLIEVMIALVILAVGILGISKLQATLIRASSDATQRTVAVSVAQQKIDDLKSFAKLTVGTATDTIPDAWVPGVADTLLSFEHIADNKGGTIGQADASTPFPITIGNYAYLLSWDVTDYYYVGTPSVATTPVPAGTDVDFKRVTINVAWTDEGGDSQNIALDTVIDSYAPALTALANNSSSGGIPPQASYLPEAAPDVIDIGVDTGNSTNRQTSKPLPDALSQGSNANTLVSFEVITYHVDPSDSSEFFADRQEEFQTVDCTCELSATAAVAYPPGHVVWDEGDDDRYDVVGAAISKATATQTGNVNAVEAACTVCCRDHHDDTASVVKYVDGTATGDHAHYKANGTVAASGDEYIESCRFKRIDGVMRVFQDWNLLDLVVANRANLTDGDAIQTQYIAYVEQVLADEAESTALAIKPPLRTPIEAQVGGHQLESRGIYIDQVYNVSTGALSSEYATYIADSSNLDRFERMPFAEVNLSLLSLWTSSTVANVTVSNQAVATVPDAASDYYGTYSRGKIDALVVATPGSDITATMRDDNDGITQITSTPSPTNVTDTVQINVIAAAGLIQISGTYAVTYPLGNTNAPTITITGGGSCTLPAGNTYTCDVSSPWTGTIQMNVAVTTGQPAKRCTGSSVLYSGSAVSTATTHNFASFACT